ncbi:MAG: M48 family metallopeptidase [Magnetovibrio sp.]|nr:M48 family metallopeptidase [Magnetovibrio sp.]
MLDIIAQTRSVEYGNSTISYRLLFCDRETLEIAVHPDKSIVVKSPYGTLEGKVDEVVRKRVRWIRRQIRFFETFEPRALPRTYVAGESHLYLGRNYRLSFVDNAQEVKLVRGRFLVPKREGGVDTAQNLLDTWYREKAKITFSAIYENAWRNFPITGLSKPSVNIRKLKTRWGSLSKAGTLTLNIALIKVPKDCIEYVIVHELCHLMHHDHSSAFYDLLERVMPEWERRKRKLEMSLA